MMWHIGYTDDRSWRTKNSAKYSSLWFPIQSIQDQIARASFRCGDLDADLLQFFFQTFVQYLVFNKEQCHSYGESRVFERETKRETLKNFKWFHAVVFFFFLVICTNKSELIWQNNVKMLCCSTAWKEMTKNVIKTKSAIFFLFMYIKVLHCVSYVSDPAPFWTNTTNPNIRFSQEFTVCFFFSIPPICKLS